MSILEYINSIVFMGFLGGKELACHCKRHKIQRFDPWVRKIPWGGHSNPLQYSCLENDMDRETWWAIVHRVAKDQTRLERLSMHAQYLKLGREAGLFRCFVYTANKCIIAIILVFSHLMLNVSNTADNSVLCSHFNAFLPLSGLSSLTSLHFSILNS